MKDDELLTYDDVNLRALFDHLVIDDGLWYNLLTVLKWSHKLRWSYKMQEKAVYKLKELYDPAGRINDTRSDEAPSSRKEGMPPCC